MPRDRDDLASPRTDKRDALRPGLLGMLSDVNLVLAVASKRALLRMFMSYCLLTALCCYLPAPRRSLPSSLGSRAINLRRPPLFPYVPRPHRVAHSKVARSDAARQEQRLRQGQKRRSVSRETLKVINVLIEMRRHL